MSEQTVSDALHADPLSALNLNPPTESHPAMPILRASKNHCEAMHSVAPRGGTLFLWGWALLIAVAFGPAVHGQTSPNVIMIITDDQGYGDVGAHGNTMLQTPELDALASQSLRLTNFHVDPTCAETRAALMSGQFPLRVGVWHTIMGRSILKPDVVTMPEIFQSAGYRTGMFGKWHLGDNYPFRPHDRGFETTLHHGGGGVGQTPDVWGNDYFDDVYWSRDELTPVRGYCTDVFFDAAKKFITTESDKPFFCYLATNAPHGPYEVAQEAKQPYLDKGVSEPMASFYGMIANIDQNIGDLLRLLDEQQLARETIVVFLTDNGTAAGYVANRSNNDSWNGFNAEMRGTKGQAYEGGHRVPCFIRFPDGARANQEFSSLTAHVDLLPTLAGLCNIPVDELKQLDGQDLLPLVDGKQLDDPLRTLVVQSHRVEVPQKWTKSAVLREPWRLINGDELYKFVDDSGQTKNVATQHPEVVAELRKAYEAWWEDCAPDATQFSRIALGAPQCDLVRLTGHDWHGESPPWSQVAVRRQPATNGVWEVNFERAGVYQFWLARQPLEEPIPLNCHEAVVRVDNLEARLQVSSSAVLAPLTLEVPAGPARLSTELLKADVDAKKSTGAFFVYASYLGESSPSVQLPSWLSPGDRIVWLGGTLIERAQETGALEAAWLGHAPFSGLTFCNLGWSGDDVRGRARNVFGDLAEGKSRRTRDLDLAAPSVVVIAYGMSEAFDETIGDDLFRKELSQLIEQQVSAGRRVALCRVPGIEFDSSHEKNVDWAQVIVRYEARRERLNSIIEELAHTKPTNGTTPPITVINLPTLRTSWFEAGQHLSPAGYAAWGEQFAGSVLGGEQQITDSQFERMAALSRSAGRVFFDMHRPQNETYLTLFRKHEQGNNAVEAYQNRPLLAELQLQMLRAAAKQ